MSSEALLKCEIESVWISFKFLKLYITAKTADHCIVDNTIIEEKYRKVSLVYGLQEADNLSEIFDRDTTFIKFTVNRESTEYVDRNGYVLNRYQVLSFSR